MPDTVQTRTWNPGSLRELATAFQQSRVLLSAIELRLFTILGDRGMTADEVAAAAECAARPTDRLLNALCALGLLQKRDGRFWNTPESRRYLVESSPEYAAGLSHSASMWHSWNGLTTSVREGRPATRAPINDRGDQWLEPFIAAMHYRARVQSDAIASLLPLRPNARVLDVGGGSGAFAMGMVRRDPGVRAVVFDLPSVVPITRRYVDEAGLSDRVTVAVGDYLTDPLPGGFDLALMSAVVHSNGPAENAALVAKCAGALNPGGHVAVLDWVMSPDRVAPAGGAFFALNMLVATDHGDTFTEAEIGGWLTDAGLTNVRRVATPFGTELMMGTRT